MAAPIFAGRPLVFEFLFFVGKGFSLSGLDFFQSGRSQKQTG
jgi:hypothetical protein